MIKLAEWAVELFQPDPYRAPETGMPVLSGVCDHPALGYHPDKRIKSSRIVKIEGRVVTTASGSVYCLYGRAWSKHREWCKSKGINCTGDAPLAELQAYWLRRGRSITT